MSESTCSPPLSGDTKRQQRSRFILITCISLISFFPINILLPSFPALAARFDTPSANIALSIGLFTLVFSVSQLVAGPLSDKWGRKEVLLSCITLSILGAISNAALAQTGSSLLMTIAVSLIVFSLWGWLTNARVGR